MEKRKIAVIGAGITGLSAAYYAVKEAKQQGLGVEVTVFEAGDRVGGKIHTDYTDDFIIELGPDSFLARKTSAANLAEEIGIDGELIRNQTGQSYILHGDTLHPMPGGSIMGVPTQLGPFASTKLLSPSGKVRAAGDLFLPRTMKDGRDQSLGTFFRKRLGNEVVDRLIEPLLSGIYAGNIDNMSLQSTFPNFQSLEDKYRSLILGMKSSMNRGGQTSKAKGTGQKQGMFFSFTGGLQSFADAIADTLPEESLRLQTVIERVGRTDGGYLLSIENADDVYVDDVIMTTPHYVNASLLPSFSKREMLQDIPATSVATVALAFPKSAVKQDIDGTGFIVAKTGDYTITACTWTHKKWSHAAPEDYALLRAYVGHAGNEDIVFEEDETMIDVVLNDLRKIMDIDCEPEFYRIKRWKNAMPQYTVGHKDRMKEMKETLEKEYPNLEMTGASFAGIGLPDCINQGAEAARKILAIAK
ncbi:protoporphyrinogen oxidase [Texcoconibacillus texcoconensis]|uniref:Coproporphyrinogen III oxidase n=1 Tax=Texcoconibacillus texcoconensis TaxID=1095777 RepID=A0A840QPC1_9BACI|nr:protoporphyrinogen oxidase [Texcoconibacillus texcoconensis]MBB5173224.1 oxygen-dependent protoporphyrinogen oxidase [Texcoconibacillus texcoconensis]